LQLPFRVILSFVNIPAQPAHQIDVVHQQPQ
jgi:hypothetical protein